MFSAEGGYWDLNHRPFAWQSDARYSDLDQISRICSGRKNGVVMDKRYLLASLGRFMMNMVSGFIPHNALYYSSVLMLLDVGFGDASLLVFIVLVREPRCFLF